MERNKQEFQGTGKVFSFTFVQMLKNKGNMLTLILMMVMCLVSVPVMLWSQGAEAAKASHSGAQRIIVKNDTDVPADNLRRPQQPVCAVPVTAAVKDPPPDTHPQQFE